ncbi:MAG: hypothetical protein IPF63_14985 [Bacteroidetes bacterium]|nr:hypothetical protein [Bacteroidota bacterium]
MFVDKCPYKILDLTCSSIDWFSSSFDGALLLLLGFGVDHVLLIGSPDLQCL